jgi:hypothetical protein
MDFSLTLMSHLLLYCRHAYYITEASRCYTEVVTVRIKCLLHSTVYKSGYLFSGCCGQPECM